MNIEVNKIITLGNKEKYLVISHVENNLKDYYYIAELDENEKDIKDNYKIMEATQMDETKYYQMEENEYKTKNSLDRALEEIQNNLIHIKEK